MQVIDFIKSYWIQIAFLFGILTAIYRFERAMIAATKCSLRNDILEIYDRCKAEKAITKWQLDSINFSYAQYKALKGNSFIDVLVEKVKQFEVID